MESYAAPYARGAEIHSTHENETPSVEAPGRGVQLGYCMCDFVLNGHTKLCEGRPEVPSTAFSATPAWACLRLSLLADAVLFSMFVDGCFCSK